MTIRKYLLDHWLLFIGWFFFIGITCLILWLSPNMVVDLSVIGYLVLLQGIFLLLFLTIDYSLKKRWWKALDISNQPPSLEHYLTEASMAEEKIAQEYINGLVIEHQLTMQQSMTNQQDQKDYIDSWVHEIKVPLAALNLLLQSVEDDIPEQKYYLVENELSKMDEYVEQVLYYARLDSFSKDYLIQEYSLKEIVQSVIRTQGNYFIQKNLQFSLTGDDQFVLTDAKWVSFIFKQLVSNAIKYTDSGGTISVTIARTKEGAWLVLKDSGIGIPPEDLNRIFDKGFTGENGRKSGQHSTGLGLYLAKNLADKLGHQLIVESTQGEGTTMRILFPFLSYYNEPR